MYKKLPGPFIGAGSVVKAKTVSPYKLALRLLDC